MLAKRTLFEIHSIYTCVIVFIFKYIGDIIPLESFFKYFVLEYYVVGISNNTFITDLESVYV